MIQSKKDYIEKEILSEITKSNSVVAVNYWTNKGRYRGME